MRDLAGSALVEGQVKPGEHSVDLRNLSNGAVIRLKTHMASSRFRGMVPEGEYLISSAGQRRTMTLLPGGSYQVDLRPSRSVGFAMSQQSASDGTVSLSVTVEGSGTHKFSVRTDNVEFSEPERQSELRAGTPQTLVWKGKTGASDAPWVAVVFPDGDVSQRKEATGVANAPTPAIARAQ